MTPRPPFFPSICNLVLPAALAVIALGCLVTVIATPAKAQSFSVLYNFKGREDGARPYGGVVRDAEGNLYGTASAGGFDDPRCGGGCGTVFRLRLAGATWALDPIYKFHHDDGWDPLARVVFGPDGALYGTTLAGGIYGEDYGTVFSLDCRHIRRPVPRPWNQMLLWNFEGGTDGVNPGVGDLTFNTSGHIFGTTYTGGAHSVGIVYELAPVPGGGWIETAYSFRGGPSGDGAYPWAGWFRRGWEYVHHGGGRRCRVWYRSAAVSDRISLGRHDSAFLRMFLRWTVSARGTGVRAMAGRSLRRNGPARSGCESRTVFELAAPDGLGGYSIIHDFEGSGYGPSNSLTVGSDGTLYGTTQRDGPSGQGTVFKLTFANGSWTYTSLYNFTGGNDGGTPYSRVTLDAAGTLYGTASAGGAYNYGVVWKIVP